MKNIILVQFKDFSSLVEDLKKKSKDFPLIAKLYIPVIEKHLKVKKYKEYYDNFDIKPDDWLLIPYFQWLWRLEDFWCREMLGKTETDLNKIYKSLGNDGFEKLCADLEISAMHPTVNGVHNKNLDFYGELRGMHHYIDKGYNIERIHRSEEGWRTPDFLVSKENEAIVVECKFIHASNPIKTFLNRHIGYLRMIPDFNLAKHIKSFDRFEYDFSVNDLDKSNVVKIKNFINDIIFESKKKEKLNLKFNECNCVLGYENKDEIELNFVTIEDQVKFFGIKFREFLEGYCSRRAEQASKQFERYPDGKHCVYILVELNGEYNMPFAEMDREKARIKMEYDKSIILEELKMKHGLELEVILDFFPNINFDKK